MVLFCRMCKNVSESLLSPRGGGGKGDTFVRGRGLLQEVVCTDQGEFGISSIAAPRWCWFNC